MDQKKLLNSHTFTIEMAGVTGEIYNGSFTVHRPTMGEMMRIGVNEAQQLGGLSNVDGATQMLAHMIATLEVVVDLSPTWWKPRDIRDVEVLQAVYEKYIDYLREFQGRTESKS